MNSSALACMVLGTTNSSAPAFIGDGQNSCAPAFIGDAAAAFITPLFRRRSLAAPMACPICAFIMASALEAASAVVEALVPDRDGLFLARLKRLFTEASAMAFLIFASSSVG